MLEKLQQFSALTPKPKTLTQSLREVPPARLPLSARAFNHNCNVLSLMHFFTSALNLRIICSLLNLSVIFIQKLQPLSIIFIHNLQPLSVISSTNVNRHNTRIQNPTNSFYFNAPPSAPTHCAFIRSERPNSATLKPSGASHSARTLSFAPMSVILLHSFLPLLKSFESSLP